MQESENYVNFIVLVCKYIKITGISCIRRRSVAKYTYRFHYENTLAR
jgi:hypothetical protein